MKRKILSMLLVLTMVLAMIPTAMAEANVAFIDTDANGVQDAEETGYSTIAEALLAATEGQTIQILAGSYDPIHISYRKKLAANLTLVGGAGVSVAGISFDSNHYARIPDGLTVKNITFTDDFQANGFHVKNLSVIGCSSRTTPF